MKLTLIFIAIILSVTFVYGQYTSDGGRFRVDEKKGCSEFTLTIEDTNLITVGECTPGKPCLMEWGDGTPNEPNTFQHTYTQPGTYTLRILYQIIGYDEIQVIVTPNPQPTFDIYTCNNQGVQVKVTDTNYDAYSINYNNEAEVLVPKGALATDNYTFATATPKTISVRGKNVNAADNCAPASKAFTVISNLTSPTIDLLTASTTNQIDLTFTNSTNVLYRLDIAPNSSAPANFQFLKNIHDISTTSQTNLFPDNNYYCFRLGALDPCANPPPTYSDIICSVNFKTNAQNNANALSWVTSISGVSNFSVERDGAAIGTTNALSFLDNTVVCKTTYDYQLLSNYSNGSQSRSLIKQATAFSSDIPTAINDITSVVTSTGVELTWQQDAAFQPIDYKIYRKSGSGNYNLLNTSATASLTDEFYTTEGEYCYKINYTDVCDNASTEGIEACPIRLTGKVNDNNSFLLNWSAYTGWINDVNSYRIEKFDLQGNLIDTFITNNLTYTDNISEENVQAYRYVIIAIPNNLSVGESQSNEIQLLKKLNLYYPKAFTPNNDNLNDTFNVFGYAEFMSRFELKIFNRWGELLFATESLTEGWDGRYKGSPQPEGTYAFIAKITDLAGRTFERTGSFVLLRK
jgi:gliding motility-associated-like protein